MAPDWLESKYIKIYECHKLVPNMGLQVKPIPFCKQLTHFLTGGNPREDSCALWLLYSPFLECRHTQATYQYKHT